MRQAEKQKAAFAIAFHICSPKAEQCVSSQPNVIVTVGKIFAEIITPMSGRTAFLLTAYKP